MNYETIFMSLLGSLITSVITIVGIKTDLIWMKKAIQEHGELLMKHSVKIAQLDHLRSHLKGDKTL